MNASIQLIFDIQSSKRAGIAYKLLLLISCCSYPCVPVMRLHPQITTHSSAILLFLESIVILHN